MTGFLRYGHGVCALNTVFGGGGGGGGGVIGHCIVRR